MPYTYDYPRPMMTVDIVLFSGGNEDASVLLVSRGADPFKGEWALPGGFLGMEETTLDAAQRELYEETGIHCKDMLAHSVQDAIHRDPRGRTISVIYVGVLELDTPTPQAGDDAAEARWFSLDQLPEKMAFDHKEVLNTVIMDYYFGDEEEDTFTGNVPSLN